MRKRILFIFLLATCLLSSCWNDPQEESSSTSLSSSYDWSSTSESTSSEPINPVEITTDAFDFTLLDFEVGEQLEEEISSTAYELIYESRKFTSLQEENYSYLSTSAGDFISIGYQSKSVSYGEEYAVGYGAKLDLDKNLDQSYESQVTFSSSKAILDDHLLMVEEEDGDYSYSYTLFEEEDLKQDDYLPYIEHHLIYEIDNGVAIYELVEEEEECVLTIAGVDLSYTARTTYLYYFDLAYYEQEIESNTSEDSLEEEDFQEETIIEEGYMPISLYQTKKVEVNRDLETGVALDEYVIMSIDSNHLSFGQEENDLDEDKEAFIDEFPTAYFSREITPYYSLGYIQEIEEGIWGLSFDEDNALKINKIKLLEGGNSLEFSFTLPLFFSSIDEEFSEEETKADTYIRLGANLSRENIDLEEASSSSDILYVFLTPSGDDPYEGISFAKDGSNAFIKVDADFQEDKELTLSFLVSIDEEGDYTSECLSSYIEEELPNNV